MDVNVRMVGVCCTGTGRTDGVQQQMDLQASFLGLYVFGGRLLKD